MRKIKQNRLKNNENRIKQLNLFLKLDKYNTTDWLNIETDCFAFV